MRPAELARRALDALAIEGMDVSNAKVVHKGSLLRMDVGLKDGGVQSGDDVLMLDDAHAPEALARLRGHLAEFATLRADLLDVDGPHAAAEAPGLFAGLDVRPFASW